MYYAQINEKNIVIGVSSFPETYEHPQLILLPENLSVLGDTYTGLDQDSKPIFIKNEPTNAVPKSLTNDQITSMNTNLNTEYIKCLLELWVEERHIL